MFRDEAKLRIKAGDGGNGCVSFRREACVPRGGPDGGDGGKGGDVILVADENYNTLYHLIHQPRFVASSGEAGYKKNMSGKMGRDLVVRVPVGTLVRDVDRLVICKGGRGGRGNQNFATSTNQAPRNSVPGGKGEERVVRLELKM